MKRGGLYAVILVLGVILGLFLARYDPGDGETPEMEELLRKQNELIEQQARFLGSLERRREGERNFDGVSWLESSFPGPSPSRGAETAGVTIVAFSDFNCRHCAAMAGVLDRVWDTYGGRVRIIFKHNPLPGTPLVIEAHKASVAAFQQGRFWEMQTLLFANQETLDSPSLRRHAKTLGLNMEQFEDDIASAEANGVVARDTAQANNAEVDRVPTLFLNGEKFRGGVAYELLVSAIETALGGDGPDSDPLR